MIFLKKKKKKTLTLFKDIKIVFILILLKNKVFFDFYWKKALKELYKAKIIAKLHAKDVPLFYPYTT